MQQQRTGYVFHRTLVIQVLTLFCHPFVILAFYVGSWLHNSIIFSMYALLLTV